MSIDLNKKHDYRGHYSYDDSDNSSFHNPREEERNVSLEPISSAATSEATSQNVTNSRRTTLILVGTILVLFVLFAVVVYRSLRPVLFPFHYNNVESDYSILGNAVNGAELVISNDKVFYIKDKCSYIENEEGETTDLSYEVNLYCSDLNGKAGEEIYRCNDDVSRASLQLYDGRIFLLERIYPDYDSDEREHCRISIIDCNSGDVVKTIEPDIVDAESMVVDDNKIVVKWNSWRGEDAIECLSIIDIDNDSTKSIYETTGHFYYTLDSGLIYISDIEWDYESENVLGNRKIFSIDYSGNRKSVIVNEEMTGDEYRDGLFMSDYGLIQTRETYFEDDDRQQVDIVATSLDEGDDSIITSWTQTSYGGIGTKNLYSDYLYYHEIQNNGKGIIKRLNLSDGTIEKTISVPTVGYMEGEYVEILLFRDYTALNMRELKYDESTAQVTDCNRIFIYDLYGDQKLEL